MTRRFILAIAAAALTAPAAAHADAVTVGGVVGSSLAISVPAPAQMTLLPETSSTTTTTVTVTSSLPSWTMTIADTNTGAGAGHMKKAPASTMTNPLEWKVGSGAYSNLTGTAATAATGSLSEAKTFTFRQTTTAADSLAIGDSWGLVASIIAS